ncbi:MAG: helicase, partial [Eubacteriales bacterium]|nr:helicase [Eubacteriales bacterium]
MLEENPRYAYLIGMLDVQSDDEDYSGAGEQEVDADMAFEDGENFTAGQDDDNEPISTTHFKLPSSIGISFYVQSDLAGINLDVKWGDYSRSSEKRTGKNEKEYTRTVYTRIPMEETVRVNFADFTRTKDYQLVCDSNVHVHVSRIGLKGGYSLVTAYVMNKRSNPSNSAEAIMFQVELKAYAEDGSAVFIAEHICREILAADEFYFEQRPILGRGRGCAAVWDTPVDGRTTSVRSAFIPEYEFPGVSAALDGFDRYFFSTFTMSAKAKKEETISKLNTLATSYENWINKTLVGNVRMQNADFKEKIGSTVIERCQDTLRRIREGIHLIETDETAFEAFCFMNRVIFLQNSIKNYAKKHGSGIECNFQDFINPKDPSNNFGWRPFQIAFILMNLTGIVDPTHEERKIVDLLYFPTGGGKTEAYLGLMAFVIANRRLRAEEGGTYNLDGGVTIMLRYTLRLLTTQQRDRITKMVVAAEMIRRQDPRFGKEPISIGFWVGSGVTPNKFDEFEEKADRPQDAKSAKNHVCKQLLTCPFCGKPLKEENFNIDIDRKSIEIYCSDKDCQFYRYKNARIPIPVYMVDEEIYGKCPTIILSTVDKFARLPWDVNTNALFGRVDRKCSRDGYVAIGAEHARHNRTNSLPSSTLENIRPFLPPELIIQDELHLITGPLGTVYGAYETIIENMCVHEGIRPKYVVSTATIKNAEAQAKCLYARKNTTQFPSSGFEIGDS